MLPLDHPKPPQGDDAGKGATSSSSRIRGEARAQAQNREAAPSTLTADNPCISSPRSPSSSAAGLAQAARYAQLQSREPLVLGGGYLEVPSSSASPSEDDLSISPREDYQMPRMRSSIFVFNERRIHM